MRDLIDRRSLEVHSLNYLIEDFPCGVRVEAYRMTAGSWVAQTGQTTIGSHMLTVVTEGLLYSDVTAIRAISDELGTVC